jgi:hypothetical protein
MLFRLSKPYSTLALVLSVYTATKSAPYRPVVSSLLIIFVRNRFVLRVYLWLYSICGPWSLFSVS